jgi:hypothetical protein
MLIWLSTWPEAVTTWNRATGDPSSLIRDSSPNRRKAVTALDHRDRPAPTSQIRGAFEDRHPHSNLSQRDRCCQAADATANDDRFGAVISSLKLYRRNTITSSLVSGACCASRAGASVACEGPLQALVGRVTGDEPSSHASHYGLRSTAAR